MDMKLTKKENRSKFEQAQLDLEIAKQSMDNATTDAHFELMCEYVTVAEKRLDLAYKTEKIMGGIDHEENNSNSRNFGNRCFDKICELVGYERV